MLKPFDLSVRRIARGAAHVDCAINKWIAIDEALWMRIDNKMRLCRRFTPRQRRFYHVSEWKSQVLKRRQVALGFLTALVFTGEKHAGLSPRSPRLVS